MPMLPPVIARVRRLAQGIGQIARARKIWSLPRRAKIAVLHSSSYEVLVPLFGKERYEIISLEGDEVYLAPLVLVLVFRHILQTRSLKVGYAIAVLKWIKPEIVVTYVDNSYVFQITAQRYRTARFLAIQNGSRLLDRDHPAGSPRIYHREFACLGRFEIDQYVRHGAMVEQYYPIGSLKDAYYRARLANDCGMTKDFDLCLVSQIKLPMQAKYPERLQSFERLTEYVRQFSEAHKKSLCVALRKHPAIDAELYEWEREWFATHLGSHAALFPNMPGSYTTYALMDRSRVSVGMHSTVMREGFGRGNRILSCNFTGNPVYDFLVPGPWALNEPDYGEFERRLHWLLGMSDGEYGKLCGGLPEYLIGYNEKLPTDGFLQNLIAEAVQGPAEHRRGASQKR